MAYTQCESLPYSVSPRGAEEWTFRFPLEGQYMRERDEYVLIISYRAILQPKKSLTLCFRPSTPPDLLVCGPRSTTTH